MPPCPDETFIMTFMCVDCSGEFKVVVYSHWFLCISVFSLLFVVLMCQFTVIHVLSLYASLPRLQSWGLFYVWAFVPYLCLNKDLVMEICTCASSLPGFMPTFTNGAAEFPTGALRWGWLGIASPSCCISLDDDDEEDRGVWGGRSADAPTIRPSKVFWPSRGGAPAKAVRLLAQFETIEMIGWPLLLS